MWRTDEGIVFSAPFIRRQLAPQIGIFANLLTTHLHLCYLCPPLLLNRILMWNADEILFAEHSDPAVLKPYHPGIEQEPNCIYTYVVPFKDNKGQPALMVYDNVCNQTLPPLYNFQIYFTNPAVTPENVQPAKLFRQLQEKINLDSKIWPIRLEIFFLPCAEVYDNKVADICHMHYWKERAGREFTTNNIKALEDLKSDPANWRGEPWLPGLVRSYKFINGGPAYFFLFYRGEQWNAESKFACCVEKEGYFDFPEHEELKSVRELWQNSPREALYRLVNLILEFDEIAPTMLMLKSNMDKSDEYWKEAVKQGWKCWYR